MFAPDLMYALSIESNYVLVSVVFVFVFGAIVGSFLNVWALRYNTGRSLRGRSHCLSCKTQLAWIDLIPVASFLVLRGRCRSCDSKLSFQYPLVELLTGLLFVALFLKASSFATFFVFAAVFALYIVIGIYDVRHLIVPNGLAYAVAALSFLLLFVALPTLSFHVPTVLALLSGPLTAAPLFFLWFFSKGRWMGLGDAKLMLSVGWFLGVVEGGAALLIAFWSGALFGLGVLLFDYFKKCAGKTVLPDGIKRFTMKHEIPFAPFLLLGFFIVFFLDITIIDLLL